MMLRFKDKIIQGQPLYIPEAGSNLLGRDLIIQLGLEIRTRTERITITMNMLTEKDVKDIDPVVWVKEGKQRGSKHCTLENNTSKRA